MIHYIIKINKYLGMVAHTHNPSTCDVHAGEEVQCYLWLHSEFKANMGYLRPSLTKPKEKGEVYQRNKIESRHTLRNTRQLISSGHGFLSSPQTCCVDQTSTDLWSSCHIVPSFGIMAYATMPASLDNWCLTNIKAIRWEKDNLSTNGVGTSGYPYVQTTIITVLHLIKGQLTLLVDPHAGYTRNFFWLEFK